MCGDSGDSGDVSPYAWEMAGLTVLYRGRKHDRYHRHHRKGVTMNQFTPKSRLTPVPTVSAKSEADHEREALAYLEDLEAKLNFKKTGYLPRKRRENYR